MQIHQATIMKITYQLPNPRIAERTNAFLATESIIKVVDTTHRARHYLQLLEPYVERHLPKPVYEWDFEPKYTLEMAVFLDAVGEIDWRKYGLLEQIVIFGKDSSVESKAKFLELFIDHARAVDRSIIWLGLVYCEKGAI